MLLRFPTWTSSHNPGFVHGLAASHWPQGEAGSGTGRSFGLAADRRIESGSIDLVILLQNLINHSAADSLVGACKAAGVPFVLSQGYGVSGVRAAIEKTAPAGCT